MHQPESIYHPSPVCEPWDAPWPESLLQCFSTAYCRLDLLSVYHKPIINTNATCTPNSRLEKAESTRLLWFLRRDTTHAVGKTHFVPFIERFGESFRKRMLACR